MLHGVMDVCGGIGVAGFCGGGYQVRAGQERVLGARGGCGWGPYACVVCGHQGGQSLGGVHHRRGAYVGVDATIEDPGGQQVHIMKQRMQGKFNLTAIRKGPYKFCFQNRVSMLQTIDFNVHIGHLPRDEPIKDEHLYVLFAQIARVEDALFDVQFEQHWLHSQTARQAQIANGMSRRVLYKAAVESLSLIACSVLQIVLLQRLFEKKLGVCPPRV